MSTVPWDCAQGDAPAVFLPCAATVALAPPDDSVDTNIVIVTGSGTITSFGPSPQAQQGLDENGVLLPTVAVGCTKVVVFEPSSGSSIVLTKGAQLALLGAANRTVSNRSIGTYTVDNDNNWIEQSFADTTLTPGGGGGGTVNPTTQVFGATRSTSWAPPANTWTNYAFDTVSLDTQNGWNATSLALGRASRGRLYRRLPGQSRRRIEHRGLRVSDRQKWHLRRRRCRGPQSRQLRDDGEHAAGRVPHEHRRHARGRRLQRDAAVHRRRSVFQDLADQQRRSRSAWSRGPARSAGQHRQHRPGRTGRAARNPGRPRQHWSAGASRNDRISGPAGRRLRGDQHDLAGDCARLAVVHDAEWARLFGRSAGAGLERGHAWRVHGRSGDELQRHVAGAQHRHDRRQRDACRLEHQPGGPSRFDRVAGTSRHDRPGRTAGTDRQHRRCRSSRSRRPCWRRDRDGSHEEFRGRLRHGLVAACRHHGRAERRSQLRPPQCRLE